MGHTAYFSYCDVQEGLHVREGQKHKKSHLSRSSRYLAWNPGRIN